MCGGFAGGGFGGASMFEDLFGGFFGFPGMGGGGGGGRNRRRRGEDTFHPLRFVFLYNFQCTCYPQIPTPSSIVFLSVLEVRKLQETRVCVCNCFPAYIIIYYRLFTANLHAGRY